ALNEVQISASNRTLEEILLRQSEVFRTEPQLAKSSFLISDFQEHMLPAQNLMPDSSISLHLIKLQPNPVPNISIDSVWLLSAIQKPGEPGKLLITIRNNSDEDATNIPISLYLNQQQKAIGSSNIKARGTVTDTLSFSGLAGGWQEGVVEITDFPMVFDNRFYFSLHVQEDLPVLII